MSKKKLKLINKTLKYKLKIRKKFFFFIKKKQNWKSTKLIYVIFAIISKYMVISCKKIDIANNEKLI